MNNEKKFKDLPEGWKWVRLEEDVILITGSRPKGGAIEEGIPSLGGEHITEDGRIIFTEQNAKYIPDKFFKLMPKGKVEVNDILINKDGANTGKVAILKVKFHPHIAINEHLFILRSKKLFEQKYLFYWLYSSFAQTEIRNRITGSAQPGLSSSFIKNFFLPLPPLPEQQKIAEILETVDNAIEKTEKIIEKYKRIKQGLMQDLLTKGIDENGNIRSEKTHKFKDSPLGRIPEEWEVVRLGEILKFLKGKTPRKLYDYEEEGMTIYLTPEYLRKNKCDVAFCKKEETLLANEDIIILWDGSNAGEVFWAEKGAVASTMAKIDITSSDFPIYKKFLYYYLKSNEFVFKYQVKGSGIPHFEKDILNTLNSVFPPLSEQKRIAEILSQIDQAIEKEEKYKQKLERLKKGLMEDLLTGKVRVNKLLEGENHGMA